MKLKPSKATIQPIFRTLTKDGKLEIDFKTAWDDTFLWGAGRSERPFRTHDKTLSFFQGLEELKNKAGEMKKVDIECHEVVLRFQQNGAAKEPALKSTLEGEHRLTITGAPFEACIDHFAKVLRQRHGNHFVVRVNAVDGSVIFSGRANRTADLAAIEANKVWGYEDIAVYFNESVAYVKALNYSRARNAARDNGLSPFPQPCSLSKKHPKWRRDDIIAWWEKNRGKK